MRRDDAIRALERAIGRIQQFLKGKSFADFSRDVLIHDAVVFNLETISDACSYLGADTCALVPEIPWHQLTDLHRRLRYKYYAIEDAALWGTIRDGLPVLAAVLAASVRTLQDQRKSPPSKLDWD